MNADHVLSRYRSSRCLPSIQSADTRNLKINETDKSHPLPRNYIGERLRSLPTKSSQSWLQQITVGEAFQTADSAKHLNVQLHDYASQKGIAYTPKPLSLQFRVARNVYDALSQKIDTLNTIALNNFTTTFVKLNKHIFESLSINENQYPAYAKYVFDALKISYSPKLNIGQEAGKGLGVKAEEDLPIGTLLIYAGEIAEAIVCYAQQFDTNTPDDTLIDLLSAEIDPPLLEPVLSGLNFRSPASFINHENSNFNLTQIRIPLGKTESGELLLAVGLIANKKISRGEWLSWNYGVNSELFTNKTNLQTSVRRRCTTFLGYSILKDDVANVQQWVKRLGINCGIPARKKCLDGNTSAESIIVSPLCAAVAHDSKEALKFLLANGAKVEVEQEKILST